MSIDLILGLCGVAVTVMVVVAMVMACRRTPSRPTTRQSIRTGQITARPHEGRP